MRARAMAELSKLQRELISRGTLLVLALLLLYGGFRAIRVGYVAQAEFDQRHPEYLDRAERGTSGAMLFYVGGAVLLLAGGFLAFMGLASMRTFERAMGPPNLDTSPWDDTYGDD
jgi:hypothetical protein